MLSTRDRIARELRSTIGQRLKERRIELKLTQEDLAWIADVTQGTISNYETGRNEVPLSVLLVLADHLGVSPDYFLPRLASHLYSRADVESERDAAVDVAVRKSATMINTRPRALAAPTMPRGLVPQAG